ncbi:MAG: hypothetical protein ACQEW0_05690 [Pseudomonadota bacterium]
MKKILIHIGKCGGTSLRKAIEKSGKENLYHRVHIMKPPIFYDKKYVIICRGPISRAISAFNWRYKLVVIDEAQKNRYKGEWEVLKQYESLNNLAELLYVDGVLQSDVASDLRKVHHLYEDISFYLTDLLNVLSPCQIDFVVCQENLDNDIERFFGVKVAFKEKGDYEKTSTFLSEEATMNLRLFFRKDYECLMKLFTYGKISKEIFVKMI